MSGLITDIQGYSIHDGPGIRTVVFIKGCGLECLWCANPECILPHPEIGFIKALCTKCGKCSQVCPQQALNYKSGNYPEINRDLCNGCGICTSVCSYKALVLYGRRMDVEEIFKAVRVDKMFYEDSGGGVTVSGGEALLQPQLVSDLFEKCHQNGIHTCIETAGYAAENNLKQVLATCDHVLYDLKIMNSFNHRGYTGKSNELILSNAKIVAESGVEVQFRMPVIPGINDDKKNISETANFLHGLGEKALRIEIMPYHRLGTGKYESLGRKYPLPDILSIDENNLQCVKRNFEDLGITCTVSW